MKAWIYNRKKMYNRVDNDVNMSLINTADLSQASRVISSVVIVDQGKQPNEDEMKAAETYDILLINGLLQEEQTLLGAWGFHPYKWWFHPTFPGGQVYLLDWESALLSKITTLFYDGVVNMNLWYLLYRFKQLILSLFPN